MDDRKLRAWWWHRQGLDGSLRGKSAAKILERAGWARSVGGSGPYLTLFSRGGVGREEADAAVAALEIHELPSARGCTYVVPNSDFGLALTVGLGFSDSDLKTARKLGVSDEEIGNLSAAILDALGAGPLAPEELREATGGASRNLGAEGKKKGLTTTLPVSLGLLQSRGDIRRVPINGRLDQQRYRYTLWRPNPLAKSKFSSSQAYTELARRFLKWTGPASLSEFRWFSGLGAKAAKEAFEPLSLEQLEDSDRWMFREDLEEAESFSVPKKPSYSLISSLDSLFLLRRDLRGLVDAGDLQRIVPLEKGCGELGGLTDLSCNAIVDRGRLVGLWEYDPEAASIAWMAFDTPDKALSNVVAETEAFIRKDLGDVRSFSLDSPKSRRPRIEELRSIGGS